MPPCLVQLRPKAAQRHRRLATSTLAQTVAVGGAMQAPTLSFFYQTNGLTPANGNRFEVEVVAGSGTSTLLTVQDSTAAWTPAWIDLSPWSGQTITLRFKVLQPGASSALARLDDVTVGSAYPDLWVAQSRNAALPGEQVDLLLVYGNRGGVSASNVRITEQLPTGLTFLSADPPPAATSPVLRWDQSVLASNSGPSLIRITVRVDQPPRWAAPCSAKSTSFQIPANWSWLTTR